MTDSKIKIKQNKKEVEIIVEIYEEYRSLKFILDSYQYKKAKRTNSIISCYCIEQDCSIFIRFNSNEVYFCIMIGKSDNGTAKKYKYLTYKTNETNIVYDVSYFEEINL